MYTYIDTAFSFMLSHSVTLLSLQVQPAICCVGRDHSLRPHGVIASLESNVNILRTSSCECSEDNTTMTLARASRNIFSCRVKQPFFVNSQTVAKNFALTLVGGWWLPIGVQLAPPPVLSVGSLGGPKKHPLTPQKSIA